ncbi:MAG: hypothetical protein ACOX3K_05710 [Bacilli bacterium]
MSSNFERRTSSRLFFLLKTIADLVILNFIFVVVSLLSALVLFFPGLVALTTCINKMINHQYYNPFTSFFEEIKEQWSLMWRLEILGVLVLLFFAGMSYIYYAYIVNYGYTWWIWAAIAFLSSLLLVSLIILMHLLIFNEFFKDDTFLMMIRKAALIARRRPLISFLMLIFLIAVTAVTYFLPYLALFISFSFLIFINLQVAKKTYQAIYLEEEERLTEAENNQREDRES